jgi:hypothetical protein
LRGWNRELDSPVGVLAVSAVEQHDSGFVVSYLVPDAVIADSDPILVLIAFELDTASRSGVVLQASEPFENSRTNFLR